MLHSVGGTWHSATPSPGSNSKTKLTHSPTEPKSLNVGVAQLEGDLAYIGGTPGGKPKMNVSGKVSMDTAIRIHNGDKSQRFANVVVNGVSMLLISADNGDGSEDE